MAEGATNGAQAAEAQSSVVIVDMGKRKRKQVKQLRRGRGKLMDRIEETVGQLQADGEIESGSAVVVVIVREKRKKAGWMAW